MVCCSIVGCSVYSDSKSNCESMFTFPKDKQKRKIWLDNINRERRGNPLEPNEYSRVCVRHFEKLCFQMNPDFAAKEGINIKRLRLKTDAVPTLNLNKEIGRPTKRSTCNVSSVKPRKYRIQPSQEETLKAKTISIRSIYTTSSAATSRSIQTETFVQDKSSAIGRETTNDNDKDEKSESVGDHMVIGEWKVAESTDEQIEEVKSSVPDKVKEADVPNSIPARKVVQGQPGITTNHDPPEPPREPPGTTSNGSFIMRQLHVQYKEGRNCDLEIRCSDSMLYAHKCMVDIFMLDAGAELDNNMFYLDQTSSTKDMIEPLVDMMYTGVLKVIPRIINKMHDAAYRLGYKAAVRACTKYKEHPATIVHPFKMKPQEIHKRANKGLKEHNTLVPTSKNLLQVLPNKSLKKGGVEQTHKSVSNVAMSYSKENGIDHVKPYVTPLNDVQNYMEKLSRNRNKEKDNHGNKQDDSNDLGENRNEIDEHLTANTNEHGKKRKHEGDDKKESDDDNTIENKHKLKKNKIANTQSEELADSDADTMATNVNDHSYHVYIDRSTLSNTEPEVYIDRAIDDDQPSDNNMTTDVKVEPVTAGLEQSDHIPTVGKVEPVTAGLEQSDDIPTFGKVEPVTAGLEQSDNIPTFGKVEPVTVGLEQSDDIPAVGHNEKSSQVNKIYTKSGVTKSNTCSKSCQKKKQVNRTGLDQTNNDCDKANLDENINNKKQYLNTMTRYLDNGTNPRSYPTRALNKAQATEEHTSSESDVKSNSGYYLPPTYAVKSIETKKVTETITCPRTGEVKNITVDVPHRTTVLQIKPNKKAGPTIVICHPTAPVVKM